MGILDDIGAGINKIGTEIGGAVNTGGKRIELAAVNSKIRDASADLGGAMYDLRKQGAAFDASLDPYFAKLHDLHLQAVALQAEIDAESDAAAAAPESEVPVSQSAAPGSDVPASTAAADPKLCGNCGAAVPADSHYCTSCSSAVD